MIRRGTTGLEIRYETRADGRVIALVSTPRGVGRFAGGRFAEGPIHHVTGPCIDERRARLSATRWIKRWGATVQGG